MHAKVDALLKLLENGPLYYNRLTTLHPQNEEVADLVEECKERDPNHDSRLTLSELKSSDAKAQKAWAESLDGYDLKLLIQHQGDLSKTRVGRTSANLALNSVPGIETKTDRVGTCTDFNLTEPLFSDAFTERGEPMNFMTRAEQLIDDARSFIFLRTFELEREDIVEKLIEKGRQGVQVEVVVQPADKAIRPVTQRGMINKLRSAAKNYPNIRVIEADIVQDPSMPFEPIMHAKEVMADTADGIPARIMGGINFGNNSPNNLDSGRYTEGEAVIENLYRFMNYYPVLTRLDKIVRQERYAASREMFHKPLGKLTDEERADLDKRVKERVAEVAGEGNYLPDFGRIEKLNTAQIRRLVKEKSERTGKPLVSITTSGSGARVVEPPRSYSMDELQQRAQNGQKLVMTPEDAEAFAPLVRDALVNGSDVSIIYDKNLKDSENWPVEPKINEDTGEVEEVGIDPLKRMRARLKPLTQLSATLIQEGTIVYDQGYRSLVYRELDKAIEHKESIEAPLFALTDTGVLERFVKAHDAGCSVRVIVDDLDIDNMFINRKAIAALTQHGIEMRVVDDPTARKFAREGMRNPEDVKLHAKFVVIGRERGDGKPLAPRVLDGSANLSKTAFLRNTECGELCESADVAKAFGEIFFDRVWEAASPVHKMELVADTSREVLLGPIPLDTPIDKINFLGFDTETTGLAGHFGDDIVQNAGGSFAIDVETGKVTLYEGTDFDIYTDPGYEVPKGAADVHHLTRDVLLSRGAASAAEATAKFVEVTKAAVARNPLTVYAGQNLAFDVRMQDQTMSRKENGVDGTNYTIDGPYVDSMFLSKRVDPEEFYHNLDVITTRLWLRERAEAGEDMVMTAFDAAGRYMTILRLAMQKGAKVTLAMETGVRDFKEKDGTIVKKRLGVPNHLQGRFDRQLKELKDLAAQGIGELEIVDTWSPVGTGDKTSVPTELRKSSFVPFPGMDAEEEKTARNEFQRNGQLPLRGAHDALEDVTLTMRAVAGLAKLLGAKTLRDLLPPDTLYFDDGDEVQLKTPGSRSNNLQIEAFQVLSGKDPRTVANLRLRDPRSGALGPGRTITDTKVVGRDGDMLKIEVSVGSGKSAEVFSAVVPATAVRFGLGGPIFHELRNHGVKLKPPRLTRGGEKFQPFETASR